MPFAQTVLLGALAGFTIFLGIPIAALSGLTTRTKGILNGIATGILLFLMIEIFGKVFPAGEEAFNAILHGRGDIPGSVWILVMLVVGSVIGLIGIPLLEKKVISPMMLRRQPVTARSGDPGPAAASRETPPQALALTIAAGIGLHNFGEGLAIGQSAASGAISLAWMLIVGFGLHNTTEGFGIAAPLSGLKSKSGYLFLLGLIGGGPTLIGTLVGVSWTSTLANVIFLSLAGGSLAYVTPELMKLGRHTLEKIPLLVAVVIGLFLGYFTDLVVGFAGA
jgi:ZIP family zinc transporter